MRQYDRCPFQNTTGCDQALRNNIIETYRNFVSLIRFAGFDVYCTIKQIYLKFGARHYARLVQKHTHNPIVRTALKVATPVVVSAITRVRIVARIAVHLIVNSIPALHNKIREEELVRVLGSQRYVRKIMKYLSDDTYTMSESIDSLVVDVLNVLDYDALISIYELVRRIIQKTLLTPDAICLIPSASAQTKSDRTRKERSWYGKTTVRNQSIHD
jgi:hypothetical protein